MKEIMKESKSNNRARRGAFTLAAALLAAVMIAVSLPSSAASSSDYTDATVEAYEAQLKKLKQEQKQLEKDIASVRTNQSDAEKLKQYLDRQISLTHDKITLTEALLADLAANISEKEALIAEKEADIDIQYKKFLERIKIAYEEGTVSYIELILGADSLSDYLSRVERVGSLLEYDTRLKTEYECLKSDLIAERDSLNQTLDKQTQYKAELSSDYASLEKSYRENESYLKNLEASEDKFLKNFYANQALEEELNKELEAYIKEQLAKAASKYVGGLLAWPLTDGHRYINSSYGYRTYQIYGVWVTDNHGGIDIKASSGEDILAANSGEVLIATYHSSYGYYILIDHGGGISTLYAHCSKLLVKAGQKVNKGDVIGYVGSTGNSSGPHLHFEIRIDGVRINPLGKDYNYLSYPVNLVILD